MKHDPKVPVTWNFLGLCENAVGNCAGAITAYTKAVSIDPNFKVGLPRAPLLTLCVQEGWTNMGQAWRDLGNEENAEKYFQQAMDIDGAYMHAYHLRGLLRYGCGQITAAASDFKRGVDLMPSDKSCLTMAAVSYHNLGRWKESVDMFNRLLALEEDNPGFYQKELVLYASTRADVPLATFNMDVELDK